MKEQHYLPQIQERLGNIRRWLTQFEALAKRDEELLEEFSIQAENNKIENPQGTPSEFAWHLRRTIDDEVDRITRLVGTDASPDRIRINDDGWIYLKEHKTDIKVKRVNNYYVVTNTYDKVESRNSLLVDGTINCKTYDDLMKSDKWLAICEFVATYR